MSFTLILPMSQLRRHKLGHIEYLIQTYNIILLILY